ncbi:MAG: hypothetical protein V4753_09985 [Pseudomonadota bacterium]
MKRLGIIVVVVAIVGAAFFWFSRGASANQLQEACGRATGESIKQVDCECVSKSLNEVYGNDSEKIALLTKVVRGYLGLDAKSEYQSISVGSPEDAMWEQFERALVRCGWSDGNG